MLWVVESPRRSTQSQNSLRAADFENSVPFKNGDLMTQVTR